MISVALLLVVWAVGGMVFAIHIEPRLPDVPPPWWRRRHTILLILAAGPVMWWLLFIAWLNQ